MLEIDKKAAEQHRQAWIEAEYQILAWPRVVEVRHTEGFEKPHQLEESIRPFQEESSRPEKAHKEKGG